MPNRSTPSETYFAKNVCGWRSLDWFYFPLRCFFVVVVVIIAFSKEGRRQITPRSKPRFDWLIAALNGEALAKHSGGPDTYRTRCPGHDHVVFLRFLYLLARSHLLHLGHYLFLFISFYSHTVGACATVDVIP